MSLNDTKYPSIYVFDTGNQWQKFDLKKRKKNQDMYVYVSYMHFDQKSPGNFHKKKFVIFDWTLGRMFV